MTQAVCARGAESKLNNLNLSNSLLKKGTLVCSFISTSHRHKPASLLKETWYLPHSQLLIPALDLTLLFPGTLSWVGTRVLIQGFPPCHTTDAYMLTQQKKKPQKTHQVTAQERIGLQRISWATAWTAAPGQDQTAYNLEQFTRVVEQHHSLYRERLSIFTTEIREVNSCCRFCPIFPAICYSFILTLYTSKAKDCALKYQLLSSRKKIWRLPELY